MRQISISRPSTRYSFSDTSDFFKDIIESIYDLTQQIDNKTYFADTHTHRYNNTRTVVEE